MPDCYDITDCKSDGRDKNVIPNENSRCKYGNRDNFEESFVGSDSDNNTKTDEQQNVFETVDIFLLEGNIFKKKQARTMKRQNYSQKEVHQIIFMKNNKFFANLMKIKKNM